MVGHFEENPKWRPPELVLTIYNVIDGFRDTTKIILDTKIIRIFPKEAEI